MARNIFLKDSEAIWNDVLSRLQRELQYLKEPGVRNRRQGKNGLDIVSVSKSWFHNVNAATSFARTLNDS